MTHTSGEEFEQLRLPIGEDDYKELIRKKCVYIDKTLLIKEFWEDGSKVFLVTRPRRFGKSIALSMLCYFFEKPAFEKPASSHSYLFEQSAIWKYEEFRKIQGTYPVIFISFKDIKRKSWEDSYEELKNLLAKEVYRTLNPLEPQMDDYHRRKYELLIKKTANVAEFSESLLFITEVFKKHYNENTIILIDEYDSPITHAYIQDFYEEMTDFMRQVLSKALKSNVHLHKGVMTGVVRTSKDGILSGLNNLKICTMLDKNFSDKFGFTQNEVEELLQKVGRLDKKEEVKTWYNGYVIGAEYLSDSSTSHLSVSVYNPWSILNYLEGSIFPKTYWVRTGSVTLLEKLISLADETIQQELKVLMEGHFLENKEINQDVILLDLDKKKLEPWSFLFFAGYLTATKHIFQNDRNYYRLSIPNKEIAELYKDLVLGSIYHTFDSVQLKKLMDALITGNIDEVSFLLKEFIVSLCSFHDLPYNDLERSLHMFVLGLLASLSDRFVIKSNLESGIGRYDILMHPKKEGDPAIVIEFKKGKNLKLEKLADQALEQIKTGQYEHILKDYGYKGKVFCYGVACFKKHLIAKIQIEKI